MQRLVYTLLFIFALIGLTSCEKNNEANLIGRWDLQSIQDESGEELPLQSPSVWEFTKDGKVYVNDDYFSEWSNNGKSLVVELKLYDNSGEILYTDYLYVDKLSTQKLVLKSTVMISSTAGSMPCKWTFKRAK